MPDEIKSCRNCRYCEPYPPGDARIKLIDVKPSTYWAYYCHWHKGEGGNISLDQNRSGYTTQCWVPRVRIGAKWKQYV